MQTIENTIKGPSGKNKIDNHADTICVGPNWKLLELSGDFCRVMAFSYDYQNKANVPIAKCATTYTCPIRDTPLFWLQTRSCGLVWTCIVLSSTPIRSAPTATALLCDDPWDSNRELGLDVGDFFIPFLASGPKQVQTSSSKLRLGAVQLANY